MKKFFKVCLCVMVFTLTFSLCGCSLFSKSSSTNDTGSSSTSVTRSSSSAFTNLDSSNAVSTVSNFTCTVYSKDDEFIESVTIDDAEDEDNTYNGTTITISDNILTITPTAKKQQYTISGEFYGQIYINDTTGGYKLTLYLNGVTLSYDQDSPIYIVNADGVTISANSGTVNYVYDTRDQIESDDDDDESTAGKGAIYSKCDLVIEGSGELVILANYNNGIHTSDDLEINDLTLSVMAYNNGLKGNDSLTITGGTITVVSTAGDGLKTKNSDKSAKGNQRRNNRHFGRNNRNLC